MPQPGYTHQEYPKHVQVGGRTINVLTEEEEAQALESGKVVREADERKRMMKIVEMKGLAVDGRWKLDRIAEAISNAGYDPELDPFK